MKRLYFIIATAGSLLLAAQTNTTGSTVSTSMSTTSSATTSAARVLGTLEIRPSYRGNSGTFYTENYALLGYQFNKTTNLVYKQEFNTNIYDPLAPESSSGLNSTLLDGYFRGRIENIWQASSMPLSFSYEGRLYLPTFAVKRNAGYITSLRNYLKLRYTFSKSFGLEFNEVPMISAYTRAGNMVGTKAVANPMIENRMMLAANYSITDSLSFFFPIYFLSSRYRDYSVKAAYNGSWGHKAWIYPELVYKVNPTVSVGAGYYSENLFKGDLSGTDFEKAFRTGTTQMILMTNL